MTGTGDGARANLDLVGVDGGAARMTTPALWIDRPRLDGNLAAMMERCRAAGLALRPHGKTHKCSRIARAQIDAGAVGVCCATPREAFAFLAAGIDGVLVTVPVAQPRHRERLADLHRGGADFTVVIDRAENVAEWDAALPAGGRPLPALVDVDIGMARTGIPDAGGAVEIARALAASERLAYAGVQAYSGRVQHIDAFAERRQVYGAQIDGLARILDALGAAGLEPTAVSGGGTGTFAIDIERGIYTESQAGSYLFMDVEYGAVEMFEREPNPWATSLYLRASVVSANAPGHVTLNAGFKCLATDGPAPVLRGRDLGDSRYEFFGDEYGRLVLGPGVSPPAPGSPVDIVTPHCDPTVNLHDAYHVVENGTIADIWPIDARGAL